MRIDDFVSTARVYSFEDVEAMRDADPGRVGHVSESDRQTRIAMLDDRAAFWNLVTYHEAGLGSAGDLANTRSILDALAHVRELPIAQALPRTKEGLQRRLLARLAPANQAGLVALREMVDILDVTYRPQVTA